MRRSNTCGVPKCSPRTRRRFWGPRRRWWNTGATDWITDGGDREQKVVSQRLIDLYPNNPGGYFRLGVVTRNEGRLDEAAEDFARTIRLNPRSPDSKTQYRNMAYCLITAGHDPEDWNGPIVLWLHRVPPVIS